MVVELYVIRGTAVESSKGNSCRIIRGRTVGTSEGIGCRKRYKVRGKVLGSR